MKFARRVTASLSGRMILALSCMLMAGLVMSAMYLNQTIGELRRALVYVEAHRLVEGVTYAEGLSDLPLTQSHGDVQYTLYSADGELLWFSSNLSHPRRFKPSVLSTTWYGMLFNNIGQVLNVPVTLADGNVMMVSLNDAHFRTLLEPLIQQKISRSIWLMVCLGVLLSVVVIPAFVRWTLRSVNHASQIAKHIHPHGAIKRIPSEDLPTEIQPLAIAANAALETLDCAYQAERRFVADAAHSLRTPLTVIALQFDNLKKGKSDDTSLIQRELARLQQLVSQLLQLARLEHDGEQVCRTQKTQLSRCLRQVVTTMLPRFDSEGRVLRLNIEPQVESQFCVGSTHFFHEIFLVLIENSLVHGEGDVCIHLHSAGDRLTVAVTDQGKRLVGLSLATLCTRFYKQRLDSSGSGLGLAIVDTMLPYVNGSLAFQSEPTTAFTLSFPVQSSAAPGVRLSLSTS